MQSWGPKELDLPSKVAESNFKADRKRKVLFDPGRATCVLWIPCVYRTLLVLKEIRLPSKSGNARTHLLLLHCSCGYNTEDTVFERKVAFLCCSSEEK